MPPTPDDFTECDTCRAKPGTPALCAGCLHNRALIGRLKDAPSPPVPATTVRCFADNCGVWAYASENEGVFLDNGLREVYPVAYRMSERAKMVGVLTVSADTALAMLKDWPAGRDELLRLFRENPPAPPAKQSGNAAVAMDMLKGCFAHHADYAWSWHCNIACAAMDESVPHDVANRIADRFMQLAFGVSTKDYMAGETPPAASTARADEGAALPTREQHPTGLHQRYRVEKLNGENDPRAFYFVLRLDWHGDDQTWIRCCRLAAECLWRLLLERNHLPGVARDLKQWLYDHPQTDIGKRLVRDEGADAVRNAHAADADIEAGRVQSFDSMGELVESLPHASSRTAAVSPPTPAPASELPVVVAGKQFIAAESRFGRRRGMWCLQSLSDDGFFISHDGKVRAGSANAFHDDHYWPTREDAEQFLRSLAPPAESSTDPHAAPFAGIIGGTLGTCDQGGCNAPANQVRDGLPTCDEHAEPAQPGSGVELPDSVAEGVNVALVANFANLLEKGDAVAAEVVRLREQLAAERKRAEEAESDVGTCAAKLRNQLNAAEASLTAAREQVAALTRERDEARTRLLSAAGDDLCRLSQEEIKAMGAGTVKIPPKEEFLASCERFHAQVANESGVMTNCLTLAQLIAENEKLRQQLTAREGKVIEGDDKTPLAVGHWLCRSKHRHGITSFLSDGKAVAGTGYQFLSADKLFPAAKESECVQ